ncbi:hypothetical protein ACVWZK_008739 [Bradyrhizobium sp. GM0.4]
MTIEDDLRIRPGRIRSTRAPRTKPFVAQVLTAAQKAGGLSRGKDGHGGKFGRVRAASIAAARLLNASGRGAMVKARVVRRMRSPGALRAHIGYLQRDGVTRDGAQGKLFDAEADDADGCAFVTRCEGDRHHFRFIVSPDDATSSSVPVISLWACAPAPATLSCANLALVRSSRLARALRRTRQPNAGPHSIGRLPGKRGRRTALSI